MSVEELDHLQMEFDPNTIEHLGIRMYSTLPPVLAELISNSYDADATEVNIILDNSETKSILVEDNGHGMSFEKINSHFLLIGRNRRSDSGQKSESDRRFVIGKKGIGKLSFFGISNHIVIETIRDNLKTKFELIWEDLIEAGRLKEKYKPNVIEQNVPVSQPSGTKILLKNLKRKTNLDLDSISHGLARKFSVLNEEDFNVLVCEGPNELLLTNELKYSNIETQFTWGFPIPEGLELPDYEYSGQVTGLIIAAKETVPSSMEGIALFSRGKLVNEHEFYDVKATSFGYKYITGILNVDFIDNWSEDVIGTNRKSLNWADDDAVNLRDYLNLLISAVYNEHRKKQKTEKLIIIRETTGIDVSEWISDLPKIERRLAKSLTDKIIGTEGIDVEKSAELVSFVKDSFQFESFKELAVTIDDTDDDSGKLIELLKEWQVIESREFYKLSKVRIRTIQKFEQHIEVNSREVPEMHNFFKTFPWILDPRIMNFEDEVTYSRLLRENFPEENIDIESNKRIDFLCQNFADSFFIIELKRPKSIIGSKQLDQGLEYVAFIKDRIGNEVGKNIHCYIVGGHLSSNSLAQSKAEAYRNEGVVYVKPYTTLLGNAKQYHKEFIEKHESFIEETSFEKE